MNATIDLATSVVPTRPSVELNEEALHYMSLERAGNTVAAYASDWRDWSRWCMTHEQEPLPADPASIANYVADLARREFKAATIRRRIATIASKHNQAGITSPTTDPVVRAVMGGIFREHGTVQHQARPIMVAELRTVADALAEGALKPGNLEDLRNRAMLLVGFSAALRRSEIAAMRVEDLDYRDEGLILTIPKSKTDKQSAGQQVGIPYAQDERYCPVLALGAWLDAIGSPLSGPIWLRLRKDWHGKQYTSKAPISAAWVDDIVKACCKRAEVSLQGISAHSLRAGFATSADDAGVSERVIMLTTRHRSEKQVREYIRSIRLFGDNAVKSLL